MKRVWLPVLLLSSLLFGCGASQFSDTADSADNGVLGAEANAFNPWMKAKLPNMRIISDEGAKMLGSLGAKPQTIEGEAKHRKNWRDEIYPIVFGDRNAPNEIIVVLDYANPASEKVWNAVASASKSLVPQNCKIAVFGKSEENYGTDLMGMTIWLTHSRKGQAMPWLTYSLSRWNVAKAAQKAAGKVKKFTNEYDATASVQDYPIIYGYLSRTNPPVPASQELQLSRYCYDAGNVNMFQATQVCQYYGIRNLPAVVVNGRVLGTVSADAILAALK